jgi:hypothetical protein
MGPAKEVVLPQAYYILPHGRAFANETEVVHLLPSIIQTFLQYKILLLHNNLPESVNLLK